MATVQPFFKKSKVKIVTNNACSMFKPKTSFLTSSPLAKTTTMTAPTLDTQLSTELVKDEPLKLERVDFKIKSKVCSKSIIKELTTTVDKLTTKSDIDNNSNNKDGCNNVKPVQMITCFSKKHFHLVSNHHVLEPRFGKKWYPCSLFISYSAVALAFDKPMSKWTQHDLDNRLFGPMVLTIIDKWSAEGKTPECMLDFASLTKSSNIVLIQSIFGFSGTNIERGVDENIVAQIMEDLASKYQVKNSKDQHQTPFESIAIIENTPVMLVVAYQQGLWYVFNPWPCNTDGSKLGVFSSNNNNNNSVPGGIGCHVFSTSSRDKIQTYLSPFMKRIPGTKNVIMHIYRKSLG